MKKGVNCKYLFLSFILVYAVALIGSIFTAQGAGSEWYNSIKPSITPPSWVFSVVWNILFFAIAVSLYFIMNSKESMKLKVKVYVFFAINFFLNVMWSVIFFYFKNAALAFVDITLLVFSIILMIFSSFRVSRKSSWLLLPYLLWTGFAMILNYLSAFA